MTFLMSPRPFFLSTTKLAFLALRLKIKRFKSEENSLGQFNKTKLKWWACWHLLSELFASRKLKFVNKVCFLFNVLKRNILKANRCFQQLETFFIVGEHFFAAENFPRFHWEKFRRRKIITSRCQIKKFSTFSTAKSLSSRFHFILSRAWLAKIL